MTTPAKHRGARSELLACAWLLENGYECFRNVSQHGPVDVIGIRDGVISLFNVKSNRSAVYFTTAAAMLGLKFLVVEDGICRIVELPNRTARDEPSKDLRELIASAAGKPRALRNAVGATGPAH